MRREGRGEVGRRRLKTIGCAGSDVGRIDCELAEEETVGTFLAGVLVYMGGSPVEEPAAADGCATRAASLSEFARCCEGESLGEGDDSHGHRP